MVAVIAKYKEDIKWTSKLNIDTFIINKCTKDNGIYDLDLPNIGRESNSYLNYIIKHYYSLHDYTCFLQGNPFPHHPYIVDVINNFDKQQKFVALGQIGEIILTSTKWRWIELCKIIYPKTCAEHFTKLQSNVFVAGAQFIVHKNKILQYPLEYYLTMLNEHDSHDLSPWVSERLWMILFS